MDGSLPFDLPRSEVRRLQLFDIACRTDRAATGFDASVLLADNEPWPMGWPVLRQNGEHFRFLTANEAGYAALLSSTGETLWVTWSTSGPHVRCEFTQAKSVLATLRSPMHANETVMVCGRTVSLDTNGAAWTMLPLESDCIQHSDEVLSLDNAPLQAVPQGSDLAHLMNSVGLRLYFAITTAHEASSRGIRGFGRSFVAQQEMNFLDAKAALELRRAAIETTSSQL